MTTPEHRTTLSQSIVGVGWVCTCGATKDDVFDSKLAAQRDARKHAQGR